MATITEIKKVITQDDSETHVEAIASISIKLPDSDSVNVIPIPSPGIWTNAAYVQDNFVELYNAELHTLLFGILVELGFSQPDLSTAWEKWKELR